MSTTNDFIGVNGNLEPQVNANTNVLAYMPNRNRIINGKMEVAQRGTSFPAAASGAYSVDRFSLVYTSTGVYTISQQIDAPSGFVNSLRCTATTAESSLQSDEFVGFQHSIEGYNISDLAGNTFTLSFWVKASKVGTTSVFLRNATQSHTYVAPFVVNAANTWEFKTLIIVGGLPAVGVWDKTSGAGLRVFWTVVSGSALYTSKPNTWVVGAPTTISGQTNFMSAVNDYFAITGVQLEAGESATPFEHRPYGQELSLCQRYYQKGNAVYLGPVAQPTTSFGVIWWYSTIMRAGPTVTWTQTFSSQGGVAFSAAQDTGGLFGRAVYINNSVTTGNHLDLAGDWTANAEL